jgi:hypothetical protein
VWGKNLPQTDLLTAISERVGIKKNALVPFPKYVLATKWHYPGKSIAIHNSKMAASKPDIKKITVILRIIHCIIASMLASDEIQTAAALFCVLEYSEAKGITM